MVCLQEFARLWNNKKEYFVIEDCVRVASMHQTEGRPHEIATLFARMRDHIVKKNHFVALSVRSSPCLQFPSSAAWHTVSPRSRANYVTLNTKDVPVAGCLETLITLGGNRFSWLVSAELGDIDKKEEEEEEEKEENKPHQTSTSHLIRLTSLVVPSQGDIVVCSEIPTVSSSSSSSSFLSLSSSSASATSSLSFPSASSYSSSIFSSVSSSSSSSSSSRVPRQLVMYTFHDIARIASSLTMTSLHSTPATDTLQQEFKWMVEVERKEEEENKGRDVTVRTTDMTTHEFIRTLLFQIIGRTSERPHLKLVSRHSNIALLWPT